MDLNKQQTSSEAMTTDWSKCVLCQEDMSEPLQCPAESQHGTHGAGYSTVANLLIF